MKKIYLDCSMGAAGDMLCAALYELCDNKENVLERLNKLGIPEVVFAAEKAAKNGITGTHFAVEYRGTEEGVGHKHHSEGGHDEHDAGCGHHHHHHRSLADISEIIAGLDAPEKVKTDALAVFNIIASAEARVHGSTMENIHFHEVGTMDAIADVTAAAYLLNELMPDEITASPVRTGYGTVSCAHGILPVPAPATAMIIEGIPVFAGDIECEMCTPTGAAILKYYVKSFGNMPDMSISACGYGMGRKTFEQRPNCVRSLMGFSEDNVAELLCNIDDMSPEAVGFAIDTLLAEGALDVWYEQVGMKKNRPGLLLSCLCRESDKDRMAALIFRHTSTIGIRETICRRYVMKRAESIAYTPYGPVRIKHSEGFGTERTKAEYEDLARLARENNVTLDDIRKEIAADM